jgi:hypothetical protein
MRKRRSAAEKHEWFAPCGASSSKFTETFDMNSSIAMADALKVATRV